MRFYFSILLLFSATIYSRAQGKASLGPEVGFPTGSGTEGVQTGYGGSFRYEGKVSNNVNLLASVGYLHFPISESMYGITLSGSANFTPIAVGVKYYPEGSFNGFYFGTDLGITPVSVKVNLTGSGVSGGGSGSENKFAVSPGIGYHFKGFDLTFRYNLLSDSNYFGLRGAIVF